MVDIPTTHDDAASTDVVSSPDTPAQISDQLVAELRQEMAKNIGNPILRLEGIKGSTPRFNYLQGDYEMLRGVNITTKSTTWSDPVSAKIGDIVAVVLYYHNGTVETTAKNTRARIVLPTTTAGSAISRLWSDSTSAITDTIVGGKIVGKSGLTVTTTRPYHLRYLWGSTQIYRNGATTPVAMPNGITSKAGLNVGSAQGCWQYTGFIICQFKVIK
ncbi:MAG: hypothetical protein WCG99_04015 [Candidatus Berkelbacteria bacterium]